MYCRQFELRNCGRFLHVSSDFGSRYKTHMFLTSEALYAGLTRERTRAPKHVDLKSDEYDFFSTYDVRSCPIWFTPGLFMDKNAKQYLKKTGENTDVNTFNVLDEDYPGTGAGKKRKSSPTYGTMETILPGNTLMTYGLSMDKSLLESYKTNSVYIMGKKRTMFQIRGLSAVYECQQLEQGYIVPTQVSQDDIKYFTEYTVHAITMRYLLVSGLHTKNVIGCDFGESIFFYPFHFIPKELTS
jgi:hypothetical protein